MSIDVKQISEKVAREAATLQAIRGEIGKVIVGQSALVDRLLAALITNNHVLIEGVPGLAKTLTITTLAQAIQATFHRIQFTPDLLPADVIGTLVYNPKTGDFTTKQGPVFANLILADEINRAPAKTQAALFEVMEERQCTVDGVSRKMPPLYTVLATQNPIEQEGTYRLPEAQLDRFMMKVVMGYPNVNEEVEILMRHHVSSAFTKLDQVKPAITQAELLQLRALMDKVVVDVSLLGYIAQVAMQTRISPSVHLGASPRASINVLRAAKSHALIMGRDFVTPDDIKLVFPPVLEHRLILTADAEMQGFTVSHLVTTLLEKVEVPK